jgi:fibronectin type 3 domain-containing protein
VKAVIAAAIAIAALVILLSLDSKASAVVPGLRTISLAWDKSTSPSVVGYKIYRGETSGNYTFSVTVGDVGSYTLANQPFEKLYYTATAIDANGLESIFSNEINTLELDGGNLKLGISDTVSVKFDVVKGYSYTIESSTNFVNWTIESDFVCTNTENRTFVYPNTGMQRFYRAKIRP